MVEPASGHGVTFRRWSFWAFTDALRQGLAEISSSSTAAVMIADKLVNTPAARPAWCSCDQG